MSETSTKPYLLRAIYEWCTDNGYTPYLAAAVDGQTRVPREFVKNGEIVLNISFSATSNLKMENDFIHFNARFGGVSREISVPVQNVVAIYARENGQGMAFDVLKSPSGNGETLPESAENGAATSMIESPSAPPTLSAVPASSETSGPTQGDGFDDDPKPPKKGGRPTLTRIK